MSCHQESHGCDSCRCVGDSLPHFNYLKGEKTQLILVAFSARISKIVRVKIFRDKSTRQALNFCRLLLRRALA